MWALFGEPIVIAAVCCLVLLFILGGLARRIIGRVLVGCVVGLGVSAVLFFVVGLPLEVVGAIGLVAFFISALFGKLSPKV